MCVIRFIPIQSIKPLYELNSSIKNLNKRVNYLRNKQNTHAFLIVEKNEKDNTYILIDGYKEYEAFRYEDEKRKVLCNIKTYTNEETQLYSVLQKIFSFEPSKWLIKYDLIQRLLSVGEKTTVIANKLHVQEHEVKKYIIKEEVPRIYIEEGLKNHAGNLLNEICVPKIPRRARPFLYNRAILPKEEPERLTHGQLTVVKWMFEHIQHSNFTLQELECFLQFVVNYRSSLYRIWEDTAAQILNRRSPVVLRRNNLRSNLRARYKVSKGLPQPIFTHNHPCFHID
ncbi:hypothetical protein [Salsuginibacillus kocurii]|uniref:hypothetical protein n=1 Tax=Salsuginibacillus kocurii TaxID=427078 RepID=UPI0003656412|nr:hypothetical protein [Salsuginibacillus kocurii]